MRIRCMHMFVPGIAIVSTARPAQTPRIHVALFHSSSSALRLPASSLGLSPPMREYGRFLDSVSGSAHQRSGWSSKITIRAAAEVRMQWCTCGSHA